MPDQPISLAGAARSQRCRFGGVTQHIGAALLFGHPHANQHAFFLVTGLQMGVIAVGQQRREPRPEFGRQGLLQQRDRAKGHGYRAERPRLHLRVQ